VKTTVGGGRARHRARGGAPAGAVQARVIAALRKSASRFKDPIVTEVASSSRDPYRVLISCLLSLRTKDETTAGASRRLFALAHTPQTMAALSPSKVEQAIYPVGFYRNKARIILDVSREIATRHGGAVPDNLDTLLTLKGVGRKTANLVVTLGFGKPGICVDTHVHRISNRLGWVSTRTPEYWIAYNDLLVIHGQNICKPISPMCSQCPVAQHCRRVGVTRSR
jgi:endonuclease-3